MSGKAERSIEQRARANSIEGAAEHAKRKRDTTREEETEILRASKQTARSLTKDVRNEKKELDMDTEVLKMLKEIKTELAAIRKENTDCKKEMEKMRDKFEEKEKIWEKEKTEIFSKMGEMERKMEQWERKERKNNIIVNGLKISGMDPKKKIEELVEKELGIKVEIKEAYRLGKDEKKSMFLAKIGSWEEKEQIMRAKKNLAKPGKKKEDMVYINDDLTVRERNIQKEISAKAKEERDKGKKVKIGYGKLIIDGTAWKWNEKEKKLLEKNFR